jgi:hypothetical protein
MRAFFDRKEAPQTNLFFSDIPIKVKRSLFLQAPI